MADAAAKAATVKHVVHVTSCLVTTKHRFGALHLFACIRREAFQLEHVQFRNILDQGWIFLLNRLNPMRVLLNNVRWGLMDAKLQVIVFAIVFASLASARSLFGTSLLQ